MLTILSMSLYLVIPLRLDRVLYQNFSEALLLRTDRLKFHEKAKAKEWVANARAIIMAQEDINGVYPTHLQSLGLSEHTSPVEV
jgi:hypothetical protein